MRFAALVLAVASAEPSIPREAIIASLITGAKECKTVTTDSIQYATCARNYCARKCGEDSEAEQTCITVCTKEIEKIESDVTGNQELQGVKAKGKLALLQTGAFDASALAKLTAKGRAMALLEENPSESELEEVRAADPSAYAIVKALLAKRSLGLLDPKHPSQMRQKPVSIEEEDAAPVEVEAPIAAKPSSGGWLNWKPASADADEEMVSNLLGQVPGAAQAAAPVQEAPRAAPVNRVAPSAQDDSQDAGLELNWGRKEEPKKVSALASNSYLDSIGGWGASSSHEVPAPVKKAPANPYLNFLK